MLWNICLFVCLGFKVPNIPWPKDLFIVPERKYWNGKYGRIWLDGIRDGPLRATTSYLGRERHTRHVGIPDVIMSESLTAWIELQTSRHRSFNRVHTVLHHVCATSSAQAQVMRTPLLSALFIYIVPFCVNLNWYQPIKTQLGYVMAALFFC